MTREEIYRLIDIERSRQDRKHPTWPTDEHRRCSILAEECGEVAAAANDDRPVGMRSEIVQVAAVCVRWLESMESTHD